MKTFNYFITVSVLVIMSSAACVYAELAHDIKPVLFALDTGDGGSQPEMLNFDSNQENASQATCSTTPNNGTAGTPAIMELPPIQDPREAVPDYSPDITESPVSSQSDRRGTRGDSSRSPNNSNYPNVPYNPQYLPPDAPETPTAPSITSTPEPATLLMVGLGMMMLAGSRRRR
ncbi:MAG: PEP-CTERM sorting domain-containing protein [Planctomycetaceae bacterium]|jgi:hypothetical protein|nr:PEP-CTERM sorting domain-containing protein [Planctomycetaceae bacterium]